MDDDASIADLFQQYEAGRLTRGALSNSIFDVLANGDIDLQLADLPADGIDWVVWGLWDAYGPIAGHEPHTYGIIEGVTVSDTEAYLRGLAIREERLRTLEVPKIQDWLRKHPLPAREAFPLGVIRGLASRIELEAAQIAASKPKGLPAREGLKWLRTSGHQHLSTIVASLEVAIHRAELAGPGTQEQALAWEGFERVSERLAAQSNLTIAEEAIINAAVARRRARRDAMGESKYSQMLRALE